VKSIIIAIRAIAKAATQIRKNPSVKKEGNSLIIKPHLL
jgi:hypothetical protein